MQFNWVIENSAAEMSINCIYMDVLNLPSSTVRYF